MTRRGFTLIELVATIVILATLAAVSAPLITRAGSAFGDARARREIVSDTSMALDRVLAELRSAAGVSAVRESGFELASGVRVDLADSTLEIADATGAEPLCTEVEAFTITWLDADGVEVDPAAGDAAGRVRRASVRLVVQRDGLALDMRGLAALRGGFGWRQGP